MIIHEIEQGTQEWFALRRGKLTASNAQCIATGGKGLETLVYELLAEKYSSAEAIQFSNEDTERGKELEEQARKIYELENGVLVSKIGFIELDEHSGCSPDGAVGEEGLIEIKSKKDSTYVRCLIENYIDQQYLWQCQMQLLVTGRKWVDFVDYNPNFKKTMKVTRIYPDEVMKEKLKIGIEKGKRMLIEREKILLSNF